MLPVRSRDARLTFRGPRAGGKAPVQATTGLAIEWRFPARGAAASSGAAALEEVLRTQTPFITHLEPNFFHLQNPLIYRSYYNRFKALLRGTSSFVHGS